MIIDDAFNSDKLIEFLESLVKDAGKKVFLILDNLRVNHSKLVKAWLESNKGKMEVFYLPSYSPHLNPEERLNADLSREMDKHVLVRTKEKLRAAANYHILLIERSPESVKTYFQAHHVMYAAA